MRLASLARSETAKPMPTAIARRGAQSTAMERRHERPGGLGSDCRWLQVPQGDHGHAQGHTARLGPTGSLATGCRPPARTGALASARPMRIFREEMRGFTPRSKQEAGLPAGRRGAIATIGCAST